MFFHVNPPVPLTKQHRTFLGLADRPTQSSAICLSFSTSLLPFSRFPSPFVLITVSSFSGLAVNPFGFQGTQCNPSREGGEPWDRVAGVSELFSSTNLKKRWRSRVHSVRSLPSNPGCSAVYRHLRLSTSSRLELCREAEVRQGSRGEGRSCVAHHHFSLTLSPRLLHHS